MVKMQLGLFLELSNLSKCVCFCICLINLPLNSTGILMLKLTKRSGFKSFKFWKITFPKLLKFCSLYQTIVIFQIKKDKRKYGTCNWVTDD